MDAKSALLVLNPVSGTSNPAWVRGRFEAIFGKAGWQTRVYTTCPGESLAEVVREAVAQGVALVVAAGGDGTITEVGSALAFTGVPLGILPTGTWNALAHNLAIPLLLDDALHLLISPHRKVAVDALKISERYYLLNVGVGLSASIMQSTRRAQKRRFGFLAYLWNLLAQASGVRLQSIKVEVDGVEHRVKVSELMVVNSSIIGLGELPTALDIHPSDGKVEIIGICAPTFLEFIRIGLFFLVGRRKKAPGFISFTAHHKIVIRARKRLVVEADGDIIGRTPVEIQLVPAAVQVIVPEGVSLAEREKHSL